MSTVIQDKIDLYIGDGARPTKYRCHINIPQSLNTSFPSDLLDTICKSTNIPVKSLDTITIKYKGRDVPIPGQEKFTQTFDLTFYLDPNHKIKKVFEEWITALDFDSYQKNNSNFVEDSRNIRNKNLDALKVDLIIQQLDFNEKDTTGKYVFRYAFPTNISELSYGSDKLGEVLEFTVTFTFTFFEIGEYKSNIKPQKIIHPDQGLIPLEAPDKLNSYKSITERDRNA